MSLDAGSGIPGDSVPTSTTATQITQRLPFQIHKKLPEINHLERKSSYLPRQAPKKKMDNIVLILVVEFSGPNAMLSRARETVSKMMLSIDVRPVPRNKTACFVAGRDNQFHVRWDWVLKNCWKNKTLKWGASTVTILSLNIQ